MEPNDKPKMTPKDFFVYLGTAISLYVSAGALLALLFSIINKVVPDALMPYYASTWATGGMRFAIATLLVSFPLYLVLSWFIRTDIARNVAKYHLAIRKWFVYLTLFAAGATIAGDLIALVNTYLGGEVSARFMWKMLSVLVVAGSIFAYYFYDLKRAVSNNTQVNKPLIAVAILGVLGAIVAGFVVVGSPATIRALRFDEQRVNDLQSIQWQLIDYYQRRGALPETLALLKDDISGFHVPVDPETHEEYEYTRTSASGSHSFELCAVFNRADTTAESDMYRDPWSGNFAHEAGHTCFTRTVDPLAYPLLKQ